MAYSNRGLSKANLQDYQGAIEDYTKAIELNPNYSKAYNNRGNSKLKLNQKNSACSDFNKAKELGDEEAIEMINENCTKK